MEEIIFPNQIRMQRRLKGMSMQELADHLGVSLSAISKIEKEINDIELRIGELDTQMQQPDIASDISKLMPLSTEKEELDEKLITLMEQWEELSL